MTSRKADERSSGKIPGKDPDEGLARDTGPAQPEEIDRPGDETRPGSKQSGENVCPTCAGTGKVDGHGCPDCKGTGTVTSIVGDA